MVSFDGQAKHSENQLILLIEEVLHHQWYPWYLSPWHLLHQWVYRNRVLSDDWRMPDPRKTRNKNDGTPTKTNMAIAKKSSSLIGDTSSNGWYSTVMLVFRGEQQRLGIKVSEKNIEEEDLTQFQHTIVVFFNCKSSLSLPRKSKKTLKKIVP